MSTPKLHLLAPPIPQSLELDYHTRQFFDPADWSGAVDAVFKFRHPALTGQIFIGRIAMFCSGSLHLVVQRVPNVTENAVDTSCFVSALALPFNTDDSKEREKLTKQFFARHLSRPDAANATDSQSWRDSVPTLGAVKFSKLMRLHFDSATGLGLALHPQGTSLLDLSDEGQLQGGNWPFLELGDALFDYVAQTRPLRALLDMSGERLHARVEALLNDDTETLGCQGRFFVMSHEGRVHHVFGCEAETMRQVQAMLRLALTVELGAGEAFEKWASARWHPWSQDDLIEVWDDNGKGSGISVDVPRSLQVWLDSIAEATGCRMREDVRFDDAGLHTFAQDFAARFVVNARTPSAHEAMECLMKLQEMLGESCGGES